MKRLTLGLWLTAAAAMGQVRPAVTAGRAAGRKPKLILLVVVDQFRLDYLYRFGAQYNAGLARLMAQGAFFTNAHYEHCPTVTAVGHSTMLSGALPAVCGIIANEWYDRPAGKWITSVEDPATKLLGGGPVIGASPHRMLVSTIADELKMAHPGSKAVGISIKDRSAILAPGRMADAAVWYDATTGSFVASTYYYPTLPAWVENYNAGRPADRFLNREWISREDPKSKPLVTMPGQLGEPYWTEIERSRWGNELTEELTERAVEAEKLGADDVTDVLSVSFSSNDLVGHRYGPGDVRVRDMAIRTDRLIGRLLSFLDKKVGLANVLTVMTADHGVAPMPEKMKERRMPAGRVLDDAVKDTIRNHLNILHGTGGDWLVGKSASNIFLNLPLIQSRRLDPKTVRQEAAEAVRQLPHVFRVFTLDQLAAGQVLGDRIDQRVRNGFLRSRAADVQVLLEPYWIFSERGKAEASHGSAFNHDSHVPLVFMGPGIRPGRYHGLAAISDIAPTLATLLEVEVPSGAMGRVLH